MLGSLPSHRPTLGSDALMHPRDLQLDLGDRLGQLGDLLPERSALRPLLLDAQEQIRPAQARIGRHKNPIPSTRDGYPHLRVLPLSATAERSPLPCLAGCVWLGQGFH